MMSLQDFKPLFSDLEAYASDAVFTQDRVTIAFHARGLLDIRRNPKTETVILECNIPGATIHDAVLSEDDFEMTVDGLVAYVFQGVDGNERLPEGWVYPHSFLEDDHKEGN